MKKIILYTLIILAFCNCQNKKEKTTLNPQEIKDINEVVEAVIIEDSLDVFSKHPDSTMICSELKKLKIYIPPKTNNDDFVLIPKSDGIYITSLIPFKIKETTIFSSKDSLHLLEQNSNPQKLKIKKTIINQLNTTTINEIEVRCKKGKRSKFYEMTIPIFSMDQQSAYVELDYHCGGLCGSGQAIFLKKIKSKWKIIIQWRSWIS